MPSGKTLGGTETVTSSSLSDQSAKYISFDSCSRESKEKTEVKACAKSDQAFTYVERNAFGKPTLDHSIRTVLNADGFWTTSTSAAMSTNMSLLPLGDAQFTRFQALFDEIHVSSVIITLDFTEYESMLERTAASASARSFVFALTRTDNGSRDYYTLQDRPNSILVSPSSSKRVVKIKYALDGLRNGSSVPYAMEKGGWYSTDYLNGLGSSNVIAGWAQIASSDTCGVAGLIRLRAQFNVVFRSRKGT